MISAEIQHLRLQLMNIAKQQGGALALDHKHTDILVAALEGFEKRVLEIEMRSVPDNFKTSINLNECDDTNVILFPYYTNHNEGDVA